MPWYAERQGRDQIMLLFCKVARLDAQEQDVTPIL